jgi:hypothetical protein
MGKLYGTYGNILNEIDLPFLDSSQVRRKSVGLTLDASTFAADSDGRKVIRAGTVVGKGSEDSKYREVVKAVAAALSLGSAGANTLLEVVANEGGVGGNSLRLKLTDNSHDSRATTDIEYDEYLKLITAHLKNDGAAITATVGDVVDAITAGAKVASVDVGAGNAQITVTAKAPGYAGNALSIVLADPSANDAALSVDYDDGVITVNLATDGVGAITSIATEVIAAINADQEAGALVYAEVGSAGDGSGTCAAVAETALLGGSDDAPISAANGTGSDGSGLAPETAATALTGGVAQNVPAAYITAETVELTEGDDVVAVFDRARVRASRLETAIDDAIKAQLSGFDFV